MKYHGSTGHAAKNWQSWEERANQIPTQAMQIQLPSSPTIAVLTMAQLHESLSMVFCRDNYLTKTPGMLVYGLILPGLFWSVFGQPPSLYLLVLLVGLATKNTPLKSYSI